jgi:hypothetical protein
MIVGWRFFFLPLATKQHQKGKKMPRFLVGAVKIKLLNVSLSQRDSAKVVNIFQTTKSRTMAALLLGRLQRLHYTSSIFLPNASAMRDSTSMLVA